MYNLFLDDIRSPADVHYRTKFIQVVDFPLYRLKDWVIIRSYNAFVEIIKERGLPRLISFDHDLADAHYEIPMDYWEDMTDERVKEVCESEKTGYQAALWLVDYCLDNKLPLPEFKVHSMNVVGAENIFSLLSNYKNHLYDRGKEEK